MKITFPIGICAGLLLAGCMNEENPIKPDVGPVSTDPVKPARAYTAEENEGFLSQLSQMGFDSKKIADRGDYYLVEGDIYMMKSDLGTSGPLAKTSQFRTQYIVRDNKIHNLSVRVDPTFTSGAYDWRLPIQDAINAWNNLGYFVKFSYTTAATADITIKKIPDNVSPGASSFPNSSGAPGQVQINLNAQVGASAAKRIVIHHLGHAVGLAHTNGTTASGIAPYAAIPSTPGSEPYICCPGTNYSVMNSDVYFEDSFIGFSIGDAQAMRRLYSSHIKTVANNTLRFVEDANGDGKKDLITFDEDGVVVALANSAGTGFNNETRWNDQYGSAATSGGWTVANHPRMLADVNGDGKIDVVGFGNAGVYVALSNGSAFVGLSSAASADFCYNTSWRTNRHIRTMADVNGDGKKDIVGFGENEVTVALGQSNGFFGASQIWHNSYGYNDTWTSVTDFPRYVVDVTGDGKADIVGFGAGNVFVAKSTGSQFEDKNAAYSWATTFCYNDGWRDAQHIRTFADVDGDGKKDIVGFSEQDAVIGYSTGSGFQGVIGSPLFGRLDNFDKTQTVRMMADMNGDGKADVLGINGQEVLVGISNGSRTANGAVFSVTSWHSDFAQADGWRVADHLRTAADVTGDGKADLVAIGYNEGVVGISRGFYFEPALFY